jgi:hypothetical protein
LATVGELVLLPLGLADPLIALGARGTTDRSVYLGDLP